VNSGNLADAALHSSIVAKRIKASFFDLRLPTVAEDAEDVGELEEEVADEAAVVEVVETLLFREGAADLLGRALWQVQLCLSTAYKTASSMHSRGGERIKSSYEENK
jgi:hypothetical protein